MISFTPLPHINRTHAKYTKQQNFSFHVYETIKERYSDSCSAIPSIVPYDHPNYISDLSLLEANAKFIFSTFLYKNTPINPIAVKKLQVEKTKKITEILFNGLHETLYNKALSAYSLSPLIKFLVKIKKSLIEKQTKHPLHLSDNYIVDFLKNPDEINLIKKDFNARYECIKNNNASSADYIRKLFSKHKTIFTYRIDLFHKKGHRLNTKEIIECKTSFLNKIRKLNFFKDNCVGYISTAEFCHSKGGYYFHYIFFFTNTHDFSHLREIKKYWINNITHGTGDAKIYDAPGSYNSRGVGEATIGDPLYKVLCSAVKILIYRELYFLLLPDPSITGKFRTYSHGVLKIKNSKTSFLNKKAYLF